MTTYPPYTLQSQDVSPCTRNTLASWPRTMPGAMASRDLLRGLLWAAASRLSVQHAGAQRARAPSGPPVRGLRAAPRSALEARAGQGQALWAPRRLQGFGTRGRRVAVAVAPGPPTGPSRRPRKTRAAAAQPRVAHPPCAPLPPPTPGPGPPLAPGPGPWAGQAAPGRGAAAPRPGWARGGMRRKLLRRERGFDRVRGPSQT